jgi:hypothetical protein
MGMLQFVHNPEVWRYRAALTRLAAEHGATGGSKEHELKLAALYERFARYAQERVACERASRRLLPAPSRAGLIAARDDTDCQTLGSQSERTAHDLLQAAELL